jgi:integrase/recombinase XerD
VTRINGDLGWLFDADRWEHRVYRTKHDCLNQWLKRKESTNSCSRRTLNAYSRVSVKFFHHHFEDLHPEDVTVGDIERWVMEMNDRDCSQNTKRRYVESISSFYDWAMKRPRFENVTGNPAAVVLEELTRVNRERPEKATWENGRKIIQHISDPRDKAVATLLAKTGCRVRDATTLKEEHLNLEDGFVRFEDRKGGSTTTNPIDNETVRMIQRAMMFSDSSSDWVFPSHQSGHIGRERVRRWIKRAACSAGVTESETETRWHHKFVPHFYRTVWTSLMRNYRGAMPDHFVQYLRGDKDKETMDIYTKVPREQVREEYLEVIKPLNLF